MPITNILELPISLNVENKPKLPIYENELGNGYSATEPGVSRIRDEWTLRSPAVSKADKDAVVAILDQLSGYIPFQWQPYPTYPLKSYICKEYSFKTLGDNGNGLLFEFNATFIEDTLGECDELLLEIDDEEILTMLDGCDLFLETYTKDTKPLLINSAGLTVNSFHDVLGRGGYFPASAGTTEGQAVGVRGSIQAYRATGDISWLNRAVLLGEALIDNYYPIPLPSLEDAPTTLYIPHWLINVKNSFPSKGPQANPPLNSGHFGQVFSFVDGIATIPGEILADVYKVYSTDGTLLWPYVYAPLIEGTEYAVEYWVSDLELRGVKYRFNPLYAASGGPPIVETNETAGKVVLENKSFTGDLIIVYSDYSGDVIEPGDKFEPNPMWRPVASTESLAAFDTLPWLSDAYLMLFEETDDPKWQRAYLANRYTTITTAEVINISYFYKKQDYYQIPLAWPGSQVLWINNTNKGTVERVNGGAKDQWLQINTPTPVGNFPSVELQNFATIVRAYDETSVYVECECSVTTVLEIVLSASQDAFDYSDLYKVYFIAPANTIVTRTFKIQEFIKFATGFEVGDVLAGGNQLLSWHPRQTENPVYTYNSGGIATHTLAETSYTFPEPTTGTPIAANVLVSRITLLRGIFAGAGLVLLDDNDESLGTRATIPPKIVYKLSGASVRLIFTDANDIKFFTVIEPTGTWVEYTAGWNNLTPVSVPGAIPNSTGQLRGIEFEAISNTVTATLDVYYVNDNPPIRLDLPQNIFKGSLVSRLDAAHTLFCGDFRPINNPLDELMYSPGVVPFTVNTVDSIIEGFRGTPYAGYQSPTVWTQYGLRDRVRQVFQFLADAQDAYAKQQVNNDIGLFAPVFNWASWDSLAVSQDEINQFSWKGIDPNTQWSPYAFRVFADSAKAWWLNPSDLLAQRVVMRCAGFLNNNYYNRNNLMAITDIPEFVEPQVNYPEPHAAALILRGAIYANLAGGNPNITFPLIVHSYRFIKDQYIDDGLMEGSFAKDQPEFVEGGETYKEWFYFWSAECLESLAELVLYKNQLTLPPCGIGFIDGDTP